MLWIVGLLIFFLDCTKVEAQNDYVYQHNGRLYFPNGKELSLWGVNFQPNLSWEYRDLIRSRTIPLAIDTMKYITDRGLEELEQMRCGLIRCHLTPVDFTDQDGNLVESIFLDILDYMVARAKAKGIYISLALINHMGHNPQAVSNPLPKGKYLVPNSFMTTLKYHDWIYSPDVVVKSKRWIKQLLNRVNPYTGVTYASETGIALYEIINEPRYLSYEAFKESAYVPQYKMWLEKTTLEDNEQAYYHYRKGLVLNYINEMHQWVRDCDAPQPLVWNCNWHKMRIDHRDVFEAVAQSNIEVVSFCCYPGQDLCKRPYYKNPINLTETDYSDFLTECYQNPDWYGWTLLPQFASKAKVVYEFETFYNQSSYLYPAMARLFRSLGAQAATMWHYSLPVYAPYRIGSHVLNVKTTPSKAASFIVAGEIFKHTELYAPLKPAKVVENCSQNYGYSFKQNASYSYSNELVVFSNTSQQSLNDGYNREPKKIIGCGYSAKASYSGNAIYSVNYESDTIKVNILPNVRYNKDLWSLSNGDCVLDYDYTTPYEFSLSSEVRNWLNYRLTDTEKQVVTPIWQSSSDLKFQLVPGTYELIKFK